jgi:hypothetical protein
LRGYGKNGKLQYETVRKTRLKAKVMPRRKPAQSTWASFYGERKATAIGANIADLTQFLAKYLSGQQNVYVNPMARDVGFAASFGRDKKGRPFYTVHLPSWDTYDLPVKGFDKYRIYRSGVWHEACHIRYTPPPLFEWNDELKRDVFNIIEDRRIEDLGVEQWGGYLPERLYTQAYAYALRPSVDTIHDPYRRVYEAFMQRLLIGKIKGELDKHEKDLVEDAARYVEETLEKLNKEVKEGKVKQVDIELDLRKLTNDVIDKLKLSPSFQPSSDMGSESSWHATFTEEYAKRYGPEKEEDVKKGMEEYFKEVEKEAKKKPSGKDGEKADAKEITKEDVEAAREGTVEAKNEYSQAQKEKAVPKEVTSFAPILSQGPVQNYRDTKFITDMQSHLRKWKTGYEEIIGETGARLSIPDYIRHQKTPFATRLKRSAKGKKMLVIADFSGSMHDKEEEYKKAIVSAMEVLTGIGSNVAVFGFGQDPAQGNVFFRVKTFEEPRWTNSHAAKIAGIQAQYPSTPTFAIYERLLPYIKKHSPDVTVTVTDGSPDEIALTTEAVDKLRKHTRMVAFGIGGDRNSAEWMAKRLKEFGYHSSVAVADLRELPPKLVKLLAPE